MNSATLPTQILRFELAGASYAFDVLSTREVLSLVKITPLPTALPFLAGVINLRGSVIPIVDLRLKFQLPLREDSVDTSILIVDVGVEGQKTIVGAVVDAVRGVSVCEASDLEPPPSFGMHLNHGLIRAISKKGGEFVVILDTERVFSEDELRKLEDEAAKV